MRKIKTTGAQSHTSNIEFALDLYTEHNKQWSLMILQEKNRGVNVSTRICKSMNQDYYWSNTSLYFSMMVLSRVFLTFCLGKNYH